MKVTETLFSKLQNFFHPLDWAKRALLISASQTAILGSLEVVILNGTVNGINLMFGSMAGSAGFIIVYFVLFILAQIFSTVMAADAWVSKNTMQVVAIALFNVFTCVYSVIQIFHLKNVYNCGVEYITTNTVENSLRLAYKLSRQSPECPKTDAFLMNGPPGTIIIDGKTVQVANSISNLEEGSDRIQLGLEIIERLIPIAAVISSLCILYSIIGFFTSFKVYQEYGWRLLQKNGASLHKRNLLKRYHLFILLMKLNVFFSCGIIIQMIGAVYYYQKQAVIDMESTKSLSKYAVVTACAIMALVAVFYYAVGWFAVKRSSYVLMTGFLILMIGDAIGLVYAIVIASTEPAFRITIKWLTSFGIFFLINC